MREVSVTERAFQIARSGSVSTVDQIRRELRREGYVANSFQGPALFKQLLTVIRAARQRAKAPAISVDGLNVSGDG